MSLSKYGDIIRISRRWNTCLWKDYIFRIQLLNSAFNPASAASSIIYPGKEKPYKQFVANSKYFMLLFEDSLEAS